MKINELLKPNEGFNLNEAQVAGNGCCFYIQWGRFDWFQRTFTPPFYICHLLPSQPVALPLVFTHAFPAVAVSPGLADGNVPFSSVFIGWGEHGKRTRASSAIPTRAEDPPPSKPVLPHVTPSAPDMQGNNDVRKMGLDLCCLSSWEEL